MSVTSRYIRDVSFEDFDPNAPEASTAMWALFDGYKFKTWTNRGHAIQALGRCYHGGKLYEMENGRWELRATKSQRPWKPVCTECGKSTMRPGYRWDYQTQQSVLTGQAVDKGEWTFARATKTKLAVPLDYGYRCPDCAA